MLRTARSDNAALCLIAILAIAFVTTAQSPIDQDWHQWSSDVCLKILTASPWVTTAQPEDPKNVRRAVLLSSLLVRQAMLRELQIRKKYDAMSPKKRHEFDEETDTCLTDPKYSNYIVLRVWGGPPVNPKRADGPGQLSILERPAKVSPSDNYDIPLSCGGDSFPWQYVPTAIDLQNEYQNRENPNPIVPRDNRQLVRTPAMDFLYPRSFGGKLLIQSGDRTMVFDWGEKGGQFTFHLADLIYRDKLDF
jgi:hypothetical protein